MHSSHAPTLTAPRRQARLGSLLRGATSLGLLLAGACSDDPTTSAPPPPAIRASRAASAAAAIITTTGPQSGVDCSCTRVGGYVNPAPGKSVPTGGEQASPHGIYFAGLFNGTTSMTLRVARGSTIIAQLGGLPSNTSWGFSPDDHRLVYHYWSGTAPNLTHNVYVRDLAASGTPLIAEYHVPTSAARITFSPRGRHLLYARRASATSTALTVVDAQTGTLRYDATFAFQAVAGSGADSLGLSASGFSPDDGDRTLAFRYVTGSSSAQWNVVNLVRGPATALVLSEAVLTGGLWQFSPCGDVLALAQQPNATQVAARLVRTVDGSAVVGSARTLPLGTVAFRSTLADHLVALNGVDQPSLALNLADNVCGTSIPTLSAVTFSPSTVRGGGTSTCTVTLTAPAPSGGIAVSLASDNPGLAAVPASVTIPAGNVSASVPVPTTVVTAVTVALVNATANGILQTGALIVNPIPAISITPSSLTFPNLPVGTPSSAQSITLHNIGVIPLTIGGIAAGGDFAVTSSTCPIAPATFPAGAYCQVGVTFTPTAAGARPGSLTITTDVPGSPHVVSLSGSGYVPTPGISVASAMDFGSLTIGTTYSRQLRVTSTGTGPLTISSVSITPASTMDFYYNAYYNDCEGRTIAPGAYCTLMVNFDPVAAGTRTATLTIAHNAPGGSSAVALTGTGVKPRGGYIP